MLGQKERADKAGVTGQFDGAHDSFIVRANDAQCTRTQGVHTDRVDSEVTVALLLNHGPSVEAGGQRSRLQGNGLGAPDEGTGQPGDEQPEGPAA